MYFITFAYGCSKLENTTGYLLISGFPFQMAVEPSTGQLICQGDVFDSTKTHVARKFGTNSLIIDQNGRLASLVNKNFTSQHYIYGTGFYFTEE